MTNTKEIIEQLKEIKTQRALSLDTIYKMMDEDGHNISKTTLSRLFGKGSEEVGFSYDGTIRPLANVLLGVDHVEEDDIADVKAMKLLLQDKRKRIDELEKQLKAEKDKYKDKLEEKTKKYESDIDYLKEQIAKKDKRMDVLLDMVVKRDSQYEDLKKLVEQNQKSIAEMIAKKQ